MSMQEELNQFKKNDVWELVPNLMDMTIIGTKWVYRNKLDENGVVIRNKARLVAQGYNQQEGIDYDETYAPIARLESIRILLAYACALDFKLYQMDVKSTPLNGFINEEVYVAQPSGFIDFIKPNYVHRLKKALYGLKQAPKAWYDRLKSFLIKHDYSMRMVDNTLFTKNKDSNLIIVQLYVDDIIFGSTRQEMCDDFAKIMHDEFEMSMMGELNFFLGLQIKQLDDRIFFNQSKYIKEMLKKFGLEDSKPMKYVYRKQTHERRRSVCLRACFQEDPKTSHLEAVKCIFRYIKGTTNLGLWYPKGSGIETIVYANSDHVGDYVDRKSTNGVCTFMGCCLTLWFLKKQTALAISITEAEYVSAKNACQQALCMKQALVDYVVRLDDIPIMCDNKGAIDLIKNPVQHSRTKHIEIRHHFLRDNVQKGNISIEKVSSEQNIADIPTKLLKRLFPPLKSDLSSTGLEDLFNEPKTKKSKDKSNEVEPESVRKHSDALIIKDGVSDDEEEEVENHEVKPSINRINFVKDTTDNNPKETVKTGDQPKQNTHRKRVLKNSYPNKKVKKVNTAKPKAAVNAAKAKEIYNAVKGKWIIKKLIGEMLPLEEIRKGRKITDKGKFDGKADEGFFVGYSLNSKAFRVFNSRTMIVEENLHVRKKKEPEKYYILLPLYTVDSPFSSTSKSSQDTKLQPSNDGAKRVDEDLSKENECNAQGDEDSTNNTNRVNTVTSNINAASSSGVNAIGTNISIDLPLDPHMPLLEDISIFEDSHDDEDVFSAEADFHNLDSTFQDTPQTRRMSKNLEEHGLVGTVIPRTDNKDLQNSLFAYFLSQLEPKKVLQALKDPSWIETMQEELLQFKLQNVWTLVDLPQGKRTIGSNWVFRNKMDERGIIIRNKARLVARGHTQEEDFIVYQMDVNSTFLYGKIEEEVYVCQPPRFEDLDFPDKVYKVEKTFYGLHQALRAWYETMSTYLLDSGFKRGHIDKTLFIKRNKGDILLVQVYVDDIIFGSTKKEMLKQKKEGIFIYQDKYVAEILKKFRFSDMEKASTPMETSKPLLKDKDGEEVDYKKHTMVANSTTEAEYVAASSCCGQESEYGGGGIFAGKFVKGVLCGSWGFTVWQIKTVNDDVRLQALIDGKKFVNTEASIRHDLKLNDAEAFFSPQWKFFIHTILQCISAKTTSWNEFSSTMASAIICLANNQKFNFSKYILDNLKKNLEAGVPFYMFPRHTHSRCTIIPQNHKKHKPRRKERKETKVSPTELHTKDHVPTTSNDPLPRGEDSMQIKELMVLCTNSSNKVLDLENKVIEMKSSHKAKIAELKSRVEKLEEENKSLTKKLKSFNTKVESLAIKESVVDKEESSKQGRKIADIDANAEVITTAKIIVDEVKTASSELNVANEEPVSAAPTNITTAQPIAQARKNMMIYLKNMAGFKMDFFKGMSYEEIRPLFEEEYNKVQTLFKEGPEMDAKRIIAPRKEKVEKDQTVKKQKEIVPDDEDDVFVNVTHLSSKPPTTMDYKIYKEGKKEHFQIIRANGNHQMYLAFNTMLKNFDREDLKVLWKIVKDRFKESQPKKVLNVFLWYTLKVMFEHSVEDNVWKLQNGPKGLARMYPLTNYTLQQMFNKVRLQVDYKVEMAYDLLRLIFMENIKFRGGWLGYKVFIKLLLLVIIMKKTLNVSAVSAKSYCCQFKLMLLEEEVTTA
uniref:Copia protein n=1 Tax=Tanacetum cinerariifolium TaxID=118510 RepID=A0A699GGT5_TANCI|nr:copia protein [Tanacetum cinerariifolium]